jgi:hypothetical protein
MMPAGVPSQIHAAIEAEVKLFWQDFLRWTFTATLRGDRAFLLAHDSYLLALRLYAQHCIGCEFCAHGLQKFCRQHPAILRRLGKQMAIIHYQAGEPMPAIRAAIWCRP